MKIGILVYSGTGNTLSVAEKLKEKLITNGHNVEFKRIETAGEYNPQRPMDKVEFKEIYKIDKYDAIVFASPVQAFALSPVMSNIWDKSNLFKAKKQHS
jgi:flavodoxin